MKWGEAEAGRLTSANQLRIANQFDDHFVALIRPNQPPA